MLSIEITLALLLAIALIGALAKWLPIPLPLLLIAGGIVFSFLPGFESLHIDPSIFFLLFIPPLLFADGWTIPKRELRDVLRPVLLLAFGLVFLTVIVVGYALHWLIPALPLAVGFALGAIVSPTDAVATSAFTEHLKVPRRVTSILTGESLINDASGLVAFKFAVAAAATGVFSLADAALEFVLLACGGLAVGLLVAWAIGILRRKLQRYCIDDPTIQTILSVLTPFAAYLLAEHFHVSGILAVVAAGLLSGVQDTRHLDVATRQQAWQVWTMLTYAFNGIVFILLGVELRAAAVRLPGTTWLELSAYAMILVLVLIVVRMIWVFPSTYLPRLLSRRIRESEGPRKPAAVFLVGWAGVRGSVTMAAALSIPFTLDNGAPFPGRDIVIFFAASTIVLTLLVNGLTLPLVIRWLDIRADGSAQREERAARLSLAQAAIARLQQEVPKLKHKEDLSFVEHLIRRYERGMHLHAANAERRSVLAEHSAKERRMALAAIDAQREELHELRDTDVINEETLRLIEVDLDHAELLASPGGRRE